MKLYLTALFSLLTYIGAISQNLTLRELISIRKMDVAEVEEFLTLKNWEFLNASEEEFGKKMGEASFSYNKSNYSESAEAFLNYYYSILFNSRVGIQISKKAKYTEYLNGVKSFGCKLIKTEVLSNSITKVYQGATTTFIFIITTGENSTGNSMPLWRLSILLNDDYDGVYGQINREEEEAIEPVEEVISY